MLKRSIYKLVAPLHFLLRTARINKRLKKTDDDLPLGGPLSLSGFKEYILPTKIFEIIRSKEGLKFGDKVRLTEESAPWIEALFNVLEPDIKAYLGNDAVLDGIMVLRTTAASEKENISNSWHRDKVGHRIKVFVCYDGDGSQPTFVIPSTHLDRDSWYSIESLLQSLRWWGNLTTQTRIKQHALKHAFGSVFAFDTNIVHRGGYEKSSRSRELIVLDFSTKDKPIHLPNSQVGTKSYNKFFYPNCLHAIKSFSALIDGARTRIDPRDHEYNIYS